MSLTPLHYLRHGIGGDVRYGIPIYVTDCGRFQIAKYGDDWMIEDAWMATEYGMVEPNGWFDWLDNIGLSNARFATRRDTVCALETALADDAIVNSPTPPVLSR